MAGQDPVVAGSSSRKVTKASAGIRRKRPIRTDSTAPELTSAYMSVVPTPSRSAACSTVITSGNLSSSRWGLCLAEPFASLGWRGLELASHVSKPFRPQSRGDELHATPRRLAATPISTLGTSTDLSLTEMATPIKPETQDGEIDYESGVHGFSEGIARYKIYLR